MLFLEGKIAEDMMTNENNYIMPDGTSRQKLGRIQASVVSINGRMRAFKTEWLGNEKRKK